MKILMVCLGNICRSPLAEGILRNKIESKAKKFPSLQNITVDSAGTGSWHVGDPPDHRAIAVAKKFGVDISMLTGRQFSEKDFDHFDKIFVMDHENYKDVLRLARNKTDESKVQLILNADEANSNRAVPDPYYGGEDGFIRVYKLIEKSCDAIVEELIRI
jgi:protein-tyrosine phosphatase